MRHIKGVLLDLNGVLYDDTGLYDFAVETVGFLKERGIPYRFVTNTTTESAATLAAKIQAMGLQTDEAHIVNPVKAALTYLRRKGKPRCRFVLRDAPKSEFSEFESVREHPDVIVVGDIGDKWNYALMNELFHEMIGGAELVALHRGRYWQTAEGLRLDIGAFIAGLEYATGHKAVVIGKPSPDFYRLALDDMSLQPSEAAMVGDDFDADVRGARAAGLVGVQVRTGKYRPSLVEASQADYVFDTALGIRELF
ncbi:MAG: TIGR01458 family HAD-type hydrolase [Spirochaetia bacterium]|nr:TIGR01458 family HAD-type hydrolase [Spirochaetia bacterium]